MIQHKDDDDDGDKQAYQDAGAKCTDLEDGDLSQDIVTTGEVVNLHKPGSYQFHYECKNENGVVSVETRSIIVDGPAGMAQHKSAADLGSMAKYLSARPNDFHPAKSQYP